MTDIKYFTDKIFSNLKKREDIAKKLERTFNLSSSEFIKWQEEQLLDSIKYIHSSSNFYKEKIKGIDMNSISSLEDFQKIPYTTRDDLKSQYPFGLRCTPIKDIVRYGESTGTTGTPISAFYTEDDWIENNYTVANFLQNILTEDDIVAVGAPYELAFVAQDLDRALENINCTIIAIGALTKICPPERMVKIFKEIGVTALICAATRMIFISDIAEELGYDLRNELKINKIFCVGECMTNAKENLLKERWGAEVYSMYGMTETNTLGMYCHHKKMHLVENRSFFEVIDPQTEKVKKDNKFGELVLTSLNTKGLPLIRYRTGDLVQIDDEPCECGLPFRTTKLFGRLQDYIILNGEKVPILQLEEDILSIGKSLYYTLEVKEDYLEVGLTISEEDCLKVEDKLDSVIYKKYGVHVNVISTPKEEIKNIINSSLKPNIKAILKNSGQK